MKKLVFLFNWIWFFHLFSAPVENPSSPRLIQNGIFIPSTSPVSVRLGYEGDFVGNAILQQFDQGTGRVDNYRQESNCGVATLNILNRIDVYSLFGSSQVGSDWRFTVGDFTQRAQVETLYDFIWGVGTRGILFGTESMCIGLGARYEQSHYNQLWMTLNGVVANAPDSYIHWRAWQVDLDFSCKVDIFSPYIGLKYSNVRSFLNKFPFPIANDGLNMNQFKNRNPVGIIIGCTLSSGKYFMLNIEGRLIDEAAVTLSGDLRF